MKILLALTLLTLFLPPVRKALSAALDRFCVPPQGDPK